MRFVSLNGLAPSRWCYACVFIFQLILCYIQPVWAEIQADTELTLKKAVSLTLEHHPMLYQYALIQKGLEAQKLTSNLKPELNIELEVENFSGSGDYSGINQSEYTLALSSILERGYPRQARTSVVNAKIEKSDLERQVATLDVLSQLTQVYLSCLTTKQYIQLAEESLLLSKNFYITVKKRVKHGAAPEAELMRAKANITQEVIQLDGLKKQLERNVVELASYWGEMRPSFKSISGNLLEVSQIKDSFETIFSRAKSSPAIQVLASELRLKEAELTLAKANRQSDISWRLGIRRFEESHDTALLASVSIPLFAKKRNRGDIHHMTTNRERVIYQKKNNLLELHNRLFEAYSLTEHHIESLNKILDLTLPALNKAVSLTREAYERGRYRYQDWLNTKEELIVAKHMLINHAANALKYQILIEQLSGESLNRPFSFIRDSHY